MSFNKTLLFIFSLAPFFLFGQPTLMLPIGHTAMVTDAQFSPDGKKIISVSWDGTAKIWDARSGLLLSNTKAHSMTINSLCFTPNGEFFATTSADNKVGIWNMNTGKQTVNYTEHDNEVSNVVFDPQGSFMAALSTEKVSIWKIETKQVLTIKSSFNSGCKLAMNTKANILAAATMNNTVLLLDTETGKTLGELEGHSNKINSIYFSNDGSRIVTASDDKTAITWDVNTMKAIHTFKGHQDRLWFALFNPSAELVITCGTNGELMIWNMETGTLLKQLPGHDDGIPYGEFDKTGQLLLTASIDNTAALWDMRKGQLVRLFKGHQDPLTKAHFGFNEKEIITSSFDNTVKVWNWQTGKMIHNLAGKTEQLRVSVYSHSGKLIATASNDNKIRVWDNATGTLVFTLKGHTNYISSLSFSSDDKYLASSSTDSTARIWDMYTGKQLYDLRGHNDILYAASFSNTSKKIVTASADNKMIVWDGATGKKITENASGDLVLNAFFTTADKYIIATGYDGAVKIFNGSDNTMLHTIKDATDKIWSVDVSKDNRVLFTASQNAAKAWDTQTGKLLYTCTDAAGTAARKDIYTIIASPDNNFFATSSSDSIIRVWNSKNGQLIHSLKGLKYISKRIAFTADSKKIISNSILDDRIFAWDIQTGAASIIKAGMNEQLNDYTAKAGRILTNNGGRFIQYHIPTGNVIATSVAIDNDDYFTITNNGYYRASSDAAKSLHYVTKDLKIITFDQLDVKYNRPDKVLEAIGNTDTALIKSYRKAWEKRIKKLGIDTTAFSDGYTMPEAYFTNRDAIEYEQKTGTLKLLIKGNDSTYKLDRFNVWVNETPIFGQRGISIRRRNKNDFDTTITVKLSEGENRIETSITNVNGTESYRMPLIINYSPSVKQNESVRFIGIGIDQFAESQYNLQYSVKDIRDLSKKLKEKYKDDIIIDTMFNENVTVSNVKALKQKLLQTTENDKVIVAYSGHGMLSKDYDYYLSTYSVNFEKPEQNGLPYEELENLLDSIPARKKLMLIDACHSGEVDKEDLTTLTATPDSLIKGLKPVAYKKEGQLGLKNSFELMQSLFVNVGKSTGATIISAAAGTQFALERNDLKNGVFTYSILEAMNKYPTLKISELKKIVGQRVEELTKGLQKPTSRNETIAVDWSL